VKNNWSNRLFVALLVVSTGIGVSQSFSNARSQAAANDKEAGNILTARQQLILRLPKDEQMHIMAGLEKAATEDPNFGDLLSQHKVTPKEFMSMDLSQLTSSEKKTVNATMFSVIDIGITPVILPSPGVSPAVPNDSPALAQLIADHLAKLDETKGSIGRLLYTTTKNFAKGPSTNLFDKKNPWFLAGTVFVTKKGVVATACHTIDNMVNINGNVPVLDSDRVVAVVEFGSTFNLGKLYRVNGIIGVGNLQGLDVAFAQLEGADDILPLVFSRQRLATKNVYVAGYPLLTDLDGKDCTAGTLDKTTKYFCEFHSAHKDAAKIASPGNVLLSDSDHFPIDVFSYNSPTRFGESGSPVLDMVTLQVVGLHYCCTGLPSVDQRLNCATNHIREGEWNEAIGASFITSSDFLKDFISPGSTEKLPNNKDVSESAKSNMIDSEIQAMVDRVMERFAQRISGAIKCSNGVPAPNGINDVRKLYMDWLRAVADALRNPAHSIQPSVTTTLEHTLHSFLKESCGSELVQGRDISSRPATPGDSQSTLLNRFKDQSSTTRNTAAQHLLDTFSFEVLAAGV